MEKRIESNPETLKKELTIETAEGTASYVGIKAAKIVGYDLGVMYFDNVKNVSFADVVPLLNAGKINQSFLSVRMPYETGAQLCFLLEALEIANWQEILNQQSLDNPVTLYDIIRNSIN